MAEPSIGMFPGQGSNPHGSCNPSLCSWIPNPLGDSRNSVSLVSGEWSAASLIAPLRVTCIFPVTAPSLVLNDLMIMCLAVIFFPVLCAWGSLATLNLWVNGFYQMWTFMCHHFFQHFSALLSFLSFRAPAASILGHESCPTALWGPFILVRVFPSVSFWATSNAVFKFTHLFFLQCLIPSAVLFMSDATVCHFHL